MKEVIIKINWPGIDKRKAYDVISRHAKTLGYKPIFWSCYFHLATHLRTNFFGEMTFFWGNINRVPAEKLTPNQFLSLKKEDVA